MSPAPPVVGNAATRMSTKSAKLSRNTIGLKSKVLRHQSVHNADRRIIAAAHLLSNTGREHHCNVWHSLSLLLCSMCGHSYCHIHRTIV